MQTRLIAVPGLVALTLLSLTATARTPQASFGPSQRWILLDTKYADPSYRGDGTSGIEGDTKIGSISSGSKTKSVKNYTNALILIQPQLGGGTIAERRSDRHGHFRISLKPGTYLVIPRPSHPQDKRPAAQPQTVTVTQGEYFQILVAFDDNRVPHRR